MTCSCDAMLDENAYACFGKTKCMLNTLGVTMLVSCCRSDCDLIKSDRVFTIFLAVVLFELFKLEVAGPYDLSMVRGELS